MGRLWAITILLAIGTVPVHALAGPPETAAPPAGKTAATAGGGNKKGELLPPILYLKAGARLFNKGQVDDALKYLKAANSLRAHLTENERVVLDVYLEEVDKYKKLTAAHAAAAALAAASRNPEQSKDKAAEKAAPSSVAGTDKAPQPAPAHNTDNAVAPASLTSTTTTSAPALKAPAPAEPLMLLAPQGERVKPRDAATLSNAGPSELTRARFATSDLKQKARWLLHEARYELHHGRFEEAQKKVDQARSLKVEWTRFEETPDKMSRAIEVARDKAKNAKPPTVRPLGVRLLGSPDSGAAR